MIDVSNLIAPERARRLLEAICARSEWRVHEVLGAEVVKERPGQRRTLRYRVMAQRAGDTTREVSWYAKQYRGSKGQRVWSVVQIVGARTPPDVTVGEPIGYAPKLKLLVMAALEGPTLADALRVSREIDPALQRVGRALASVHKAACAQDASILKTHGPREEIEVLTEARRRVAASPLPLEWIDRFLETSSRVEEELTQYGDLSQGRTLLHRDFHPGQIVLLDDGIGLLDWDDAAVGEPELDLGNLEAHLVLEDFERRGAVLDAPRRTRALRSGYLERGEINLGRLATYTRSALLRLATLERLADPRRSVLGWVTLARALTDVAARLQPDMAPRARA